MKQVMHETEEKQYASNRRLKKEFQQHCSKSRQLLGNKPSAVLNFSLQCQMGVMVGKFVLNQLFHLSGFGTGWVQNFDKTYDLMKQVMHETEEKQYASNRRLKKEFHPQSALPPVWIWNSAVETPFLICGLRHTVFLLFHA
jgi:hypothetical protein